MAANPRSEDRAKDAALAILALEVVSHRALRSAIALTAVNAAAMNLPIPMASKLVGVAATTAIESVRIESRRRSAIAFRRQTGLVVVGADGVSDHAAATYAGRGLERAFAEAATEASTVVGPRAAVRGSAAIIERDVQRTATTELVDAWNNETKALAEKSRARIVFTWVAELDRRSCPDCVGLDGTSGVGDDAFGGDFPPLHPNCRCYVVSEYEQ